jgi:hopanoid biosynthesis associated radical SAM protein HpnH
MKFHPSLLFSLTSYLITTGIRKKKRAPIVLMLEPLHLCNLACRGCGRIREYKETIREQLSLADCITAIDEAQAPVVTITGGEPLLFPYLPVLIDEAIKRRKHIYLCTNGILLSDFVEKASPSPYLNINVSLDGLEETHDRLRNARGVFAKAVEGIKEAKKNGFRVVINTTVYYDTDNGELLSLFELLKTVGVDGILVAPGFSYYQSDREIFLTRNQVREKFRSFDGALSRFPIMSTPLYLDFLRGEREFCCTPWGNPTRNVRGWKSPCYLITDRHYATFQEMIDKTPWDNYGPGKDPRCENCMMHCGFEPTIAFETGKRLGDVVRMVKWNLS